MITWRHVGSQISNKETFAALPLLVQFYILFQEQSNRSRQVKPRIHIAVQAMQFILSGHISLYFLSALFFSETMTALYQIFTVVVNFL